MTTIRASRCRLFFKPKTRGWFVVLIAAAVLLCGCAPASTQHEPRTLPPASPQDQKPETNASVLVGKVVRVVDGDTIDVVDSAMRAHRIRLKGIDAPEKSQAFAIEATRSLASMIIGKEVVVEWNKVDERNRIIGRILVKDRDICLEQIRAGMAWHFKRYQNEQGEQERELYDRFETEARSDRRGLWTDPAPIEPWVIRDHQRKTSLETSEDPSSIIRSPDSQNKLIRGNRRSMIYHWPGCPNYDDIAMHNRVLFSTAAEAEQAGYRAARNCH
jgi:endonuclease YncB( thermonuclease family)